MMDHTEMRPGHPALTDSQTGLPNELHWDTVFGIVFAAANRGIPLTLILLEIDEMEAWRGAREADAVHRTLEALGAVLGGATRQSDLAARTAEDRFSLALLDCNLAGGRLVADRLDAVLEPFRKGPGLSFSMGVAAFNRDMKDPSNLVEAAEEALRSAQAQGGNRVEFLD